MPRAAVPRWKAGERWAGRHPIDRDRQRARTEPGLPPIRKLRGMSRFAQLLQVFAALLGLIAVPGSAFGAAAIEGADPLLPIPKASAPLPPREAISQPSPAPVASAPLPPRRTTSQPLPPPPEASAPLPPRETTFQPPPREARPGARSQESALSMAPQGSSRPPRPAPENSALAERASKFINSYWEQSSARGDEALRYLSSVYAPIVNYYGQQRTRDSVLQDKHAFLRRWPIRQTWPVSGAGNPTISCDRARAECAITGLRDFAAESPERGARSAGMVRYAYKVRFVDGTAQIVAESSKVVSAGAIAANSPAALLPPR